MTDIFQKPDRFYVDAHKEVVAAKNAEIAAADQKLADLVTKLEKRKEYAKYYTKGGPAGITVFARDEYAWLEALILSVKGER
jgi:hypothetical protein